MLERILGGALLFSVVCCTDAAPSQWIGATYPAIRSKLIKAGWKPRPTWSTLAKGELDKDEGNAARFSRAGYREIESCSGTGRNFCVFNFVRREACLQVVTAGERPASAIVTALSSECPDPAALYRPAGVERTCDDAG